jgi:hypothetical protein
MWLAHMVLAWEECAKGTPEGLSKAADLTARAGEKLYFESIMKPAAYQYFPGHAQESFKNLTAPDLIGIFFPFI